MGCAYAEEHDPDRLTLKAGATRSDDSNYLRAPDSKAVADQISQQAQQRALEAAEGSGKMLLGMFFSMLLGLTAAAGGAMLGVRREQRRMRFETRGQMTHGMIVQTD